MEVKYDNFKVFYPSLCQLYFFVPDIPSLYIYSKRTSGFDMAPPASAMLAAGSGAAAAAAAAAAGTYAFTRFKIVIFC